MRAEAEIDAVLFFGLIVFPVLLLILVNFFAKRLPNTKPDGSNVQMALDIQRIRFAEEQRMFDDLKKRN